MERVAIGDLFERVARGAPDREAFVFPEADVRWTWGETLGLVQRLAKGLIGIGVDAGDHVAIWATNRPEWVLLQLAIAKVGGVLVPVNVGYGADDVAYVLEHCDATTLFVTDRTRNADALAVLAACCPELPGARPGRLSSRRYPHLKRVALLDDHRGAGVFAWSEVLAASAGITDHLLRRREEGVRSSDVVAVQYTSGITGRPQGVELTHDNLVNDAWHVAEAMRFGPHDRLCVPVPFHAPLGWILGTVMTLCRSATMIVPAAQPDAEATLAAIAAERATAVHGTPSTFRSLLAHRRFHDYDLTSLRTGLVAGARCPPDLLRQVAQRMHAREITVGYGLAEATAIVTQTRTEDPLELRGTSVGRALPHVEVRIVDPGGHELPRGDEGELWCRGYPVMRGYYKARAATAAVLNREGWFRTGDLATMDEHGYCRLTGRTEDRVRRGDVVVDAREIETLLRSHPAVEDAAVFGVADAPAGEELAGWVRLRAGATATTEDIREFCRRRVGYVKVPRWVWIVDEYPTTADGQVQKFRMREQMLAEAHR